MHKITKCIIPAAGLGTRLLPATKSQPKEMVPVGRKPVIQHVVEEAIGAGIRQILIVTGAQKRSIEDHFDRNRILEDSLKGKGNDAVIDEINFLEKTDTQIFYTRQPEPTGLADAVMLGRSFVDDEPFAVSLGDSIIQNYKGGSFLWKLLDAHRRCGASASIALERVDKKQISRFGVVKPGVADGLSLRLEGLVEKPSPNEAPSDLAIAARYVFDPCIFGAIEKTNPGIGGEKQLTDAIRLLLDEGEPVWGYMLGSDEKRHDIGNLRTYALAFADMCLHDPEIGKEFREDLSRLLSRK